MAGRAPARLVVAGQAHEAVDARQGRDLRVAGGTAGDEGRQRLGEARGGAVRPG